MTRAFTETLLVDWNGDGAFDHALSDLSPYLMSYDTDRTLETALAVGVQGKTVGELQATLTAGAGQLLSPWRTDQPLYRRARAGFAVRATSWIAGQGIRRFTGVLRSLSIDSGRGVKLTAFDPVDPLYRPVRVPTVIGRDAPPPHVLNPGLCAHWVISDALEQVGLPLGPPRLSGVRVAASMHGSAAPNVGTLDHAKQTILDKEVADPLSFGLTGQQGTPALHNGPPKGFGNDRVSVDYVASQPISLANVGDAARVVFDVWLDATTGRGVGVRLRPVIAGRIGPAVYVQQYASAGIITLSRTSGGTEVSYVFPSSSLTRRVWHRVAVDVKYMTATTARVRWQADAGALKESTLTIGAIPGGNTQTTADNAQLTTPYITASVDDPRTAENVRVQHLQVATGEIDTTVWSAWAPAADIETDLAPLTVTAPFSGSAKELLTELAEAEQAAHGFTELGRYFYRSRSKWRAYVPLLQITAANELTALSVDESQERAARTIVVPHYMPGPIVKRVYELSTPLRIPPGSTLTLTVTLTDPVVQIPKAIYGYTGVVAGAEFMRYTANAVADGTGAEMDVGLTAVNRGAEADLTIVNPASVDAFMVGPSTWAALGVPYSEWSGKPFLVIQGIAAALGDEVTVSRDDPTSPSQDTNTAPSNPWRQGQARALSLLIELAGELHHPPPTLENIDVVGDPRLQLGDCVTLVDPVTGVNDPAHIVSIHSRHSPGSISQTVAVQMVGRPGQWLLGVTGRTELGTTTYI